MTTPALTIPGRNGITAITYRGSIKLEIQAVGRVTVSRWGLAEGDVVWRVPTSLAISLSPSLGIRHPLINYLFMERIDFEFDKDYTNITGHFVGAYPGATPTYEYQPSAGEDPVQSNPNFTNILVAAGSAFTAFTGPNNSWSGFLFGAGDNLAGFTSYIVSQGFWVESVVSNGPPDCSQDGRITSPNGSPPSSDGNWLQMPTFFQQRATIFDIRRSWKNSGRIPFPTSVY